MLIVRGLARKFFIMQSLGIAELLYLTQGTDTEDRIVKVYDWTFERRKAVVQALMAFQGAFVVAWFAALIRKDFASLPPLFVLLTVLVGLGGTSMLEIVLYLRLRSLNRQLIVALMMFDVFKRYRMWIASWIEG